jgi:hypothetical protein
VNLDTPAPMVTLGPPPDATYFALDRAMACPACLVTFTAQRACPACASKDLYPLDTFFARRNGRAHEAATVAELDRLHVLKAS